MKNNILWRCRRGTKELDLLLESYFRSNHHKWSLNDFCLFEEFLDLNDEILSEWLIHDNCPEENKFLHLVKNIKSNYINR